MCFLFERIKSTDKSTDKKKNVTALQQGRPALAAGRRRSIGRRSGHAPSRAGVRDLVRRLPWGGTLKSFPVAGSGNTVWAYGWYPVAVVSAATVNGARQRGLLLLRRAKCHWRVAHRPSDHAYD
jgi:hypothetical protein